MTPGGGPRERRLSGDPGYARLEVFKQDLDAALAYASPSGNRPKIRTILAATGIGSTDTIFRALNAKDSSTPSPDTVRRLAAVYDPSGADYWLKRRDLLASDPDDETAARPADVTPDPVPRHDIQDGVDTSPLFSRHRGAVRVAAALIGAAAIAAAAIAIANDPNTDASNDKSTDTTTEPATPPAEQPSPSATDAETTVTDYSDPIAEGCVYVDPPPERLKTEVLESVGQVSLVYSAKCDAYWARAERTDGREVGNHIDISLTPQDSARAPVPANDPDAAAVYTYLLTAGDASGFCVDATFWVDRKQIKSPTICVDKPS